MKRLRWITAVCLLLSAGLLAFTTCRSVRQTDKTLPVITVPEETLVLSVADYGSDRLLEGVTAWDDTDGDLTHRILMQEPVQQSGSLMQVTYLVADSSSHVASAVRNVEFSDYRPPRFVLTAPLQYAPGSAIRVKDRLSAQDVLDGDLTERIRVHANGLSPQNEGVYPVSFEVSNSLGDRSAVTLDVEIGSSRPGQPVIRLKEYLIYCGAGGPADPLSYVTEVIGGEKSQVEVSLPDGGFRTGVNTVRYTCVNDEGVRGTTVLYVVVE